MTAHVLRLPHEFASIDPAVRQQTERFASADGFPLSGRLYLPAKTTPDVAALMMHPRGDFGRHYLAPRLTEAGYALFAANSRHLNNDADALHERLLLDVAGALAHLRALGFRRLVLVGNSGGGSLFAFYLEQAGRAPAERLECAPSGDRVPLGRFDLPQADALILLAAHAGEGRFLLERLDPSVVDEGDPSAVNPRLDMYDGRNGYRPMEAGPSSYSKDFLAEFRAAQRARCERIDRQSLAWCEEAAWWKARARDPDAGSGGSERDRAQRRGMLRRYLVIYRTLADPRYLDPALDPSERTLGSIFSRGLDPVRGNYGEGLARTMSARGWLSTWSGLASNAELERTLPGVRVPTLLVNAAADQEIYPSEAHAAFDAIAAEDKAFVEVGGADHYFRPLPGAPDDDPLRRAWREFLLPWLAERFPL